MATKIDVRKAKYKAQGTTSYRIYDPCSGKVTSNLSEATTYVVYNSVQKTRDCHDNPGWQNRIRLHQNATGLYGASGTLTHISEAQGNIFLRSKCPNTGQYRVTSEAWTSGGVATIGSITVPDFTSLRSQAQSKCYSSLLSEADAVRSQMLVTLGEMHQTMRMLHDPLRALSVLTLNYLGTFNEKDVKFMRRKFPKKFRKFANERYLEFTYGWKPLSADLHQLVQSVKQFQLDPTYTDIQGYGKASSGSVSGTTSIRMTSNISAPTPYLLYSDMATIQCSMFAKGQVKNVSATSAPLDAALYYTGLNLPSVLPAVWELIPYSFLVDYFTNVGDVIRGSCVGFGNVSWGMTSTKDYASTTRTLRYDESKTRNTYGDSFSSASFYSDPHKSEYFNFQRVLGLPSVPSLQVEIPGIDYFGLKKYLNSLSLAYSKAVR